MTVPGGDRPRPARPRQGPPNPASSRPVCARRSRRNRPPTWPPLRCSTASPRRRGCPAPHRPPAPGSPPPSVTCPRAGRTRVTTSFARALSGQHAEIVRSDGGTSRLDVERWRGAAAGEDSWLLDRCRGATVDLGCGPGRLVEALPGRAPLRRADRGGRDPRAAPRRCREGVSAPARPAGPGAWGTTRDLRTRHHPGTRPARVAAIGTQRTQRGQPVSPPRVTTTS